MFSQHQPTHHVGSMVDTAMPNMTNRVPNCESDQVRRINLCIKETSALKMKTRGGPPQNIFRSRSDDRWSNVFKLYKQTLQTWSLSLQSNFVFKKKLTINCDTFATQLCGSTTGRNVKYLRRILQPDTQNRENSDPIHDGFSAASAQPTKI